MKPTSFLWLLALVSGVLIPVQAAANAALSKSIHGNVAFAVLILFAVAVAATAVSVLVSGASVPPTAELRGRSLVELHRRVHRSLLRLHDHVFGAAFGSGHRDRFDRHRSGDGQPDDRPLRSAPLPDISCEPIPHVRGRVHGDRCVPGAAAVKGRLYGWSRTTEGEVWTAVD